MRCPHPLGADAAAFVAGGLDELGVVWREGVEANTVEQWAQRAGSVENTAVYDVDADRHAVVLVHVGHEVLTEGEADTATTCGAHEDQRPKLVASRVEVFELPAYVARLELQVAQKQLALSLVSQLA